MTDARLIALPAALLAVFSLTACGGGTAKAQAAAAQPAATATPAPSAEGATAPTLDAGTVTGTVAESMNGGGYTYVRLQTGKDDVWIAASEFDVKAGERLTAPLDMAMQNFHSKTLNRDFPVIYFVSQIGRDGQVPTPPAAPRAAPAMSSHQSATMVESIPAAPGGLSIANVWAKHEALAGKSVVIRGKVVKVNNGIMDRNWIHIQDGSGSATDRTNDLTVTTTSEARVGDIVTASGALAVKKDFGSGYAYDAILENATLTSK